MRIFARATALLSALLLASASFAARPAAPASERDALAIGLLSGPGLPGATLELYLEVQVNGAETPRVMQVLTGANGRDYAWSDNLRELGIGGLPPASYVDLGRIDGLDYRIDKLAQRLELQASAARLQRPTQTFSNDAERYHPAGSANGALLNYVLAGSGGERQRDASAYSDARVFGAWGVVDSTALSSWHRDGETIAYRRLDTTYSWSAQQALWTLSVGDFVSGALAWSRPTRLGGLQWRRDFGLQPGLLSFPLPAFFGQAALPSTLELYVNGMREFTGQAQPGPFRIDAVPHLDGAGSAQLVVTDALGRRDVVDLDFYAAEQLLKPGLADYSLEIGSVRRDYGLSSFAYDDHPAASGSLRYGLGRALTAEAHAEASDDLALGGAGLSARLGTLGVVNGAYAHSVGDGRQGRQTALGYSWSNGRLTAEIAGTRASAGYRDLASREGRAPPRVSDRALLGLGLGPAGSVSLGYTRLIADDDSRYRTANLQYSISATERLSAYIGYAHDLDQGRDDLLFAGLNCAFGTRLNAGLDVQAHDGELRSGASLVRPLSPDGGVGWNLQAQHGEDGDAAQGELAWRAGWGQLDLGLRRFDSGEQLYGSLEGSLVFMDRDVFAARRVDEAFALISTDGIPGVPISLENRPIGVTDARGHYLLTGLKAWQPNQLSIDTLGLPAQVQADAVRADAVPAARRGVRVDFGLRTVRAALVALRDAGGRPLPVGSRIRRRDGSGPDVLVGYDGQAYLEDLDMHNAIVVFTPDGARCEAQFELGPGDGGLPYIDPLPCR